MSESVLNTIAESVRVRMEQRRQKVSFVELTEAVKAARKPLPFSAEFRKPGVHTIAEVKFRSPALGVLEASNVGLATRIAREYRQGGARAISVLTEEDYFHGSYNYLREIRKLEPDALLLMKDFVVDEYQILEGRVNGADAVLLIVALLGKARTQELMTFAQEQGLSTLVEVHDEPELSDAIEIGADLIGINNRNLKTLEVNLQTSFELIQKAPAGVAMISESGIQTAQQMSDLMKSGFSGFLIGSALMTSGGPGNALKKLLDEVQSSCQ